MFNKKQQQNKPLIKHFNYKTPLNMAVKRAYANTITVKNVKNDPNLVLNALEMMSISNQVNLKVFLPKFAV